MRTDLEIQEDGFRALKEHLGPVEAERFITLILRQPFDYTEWRKNLWPDISVRELSRMAMEHQKQLEDL